MRLHSFFVPQLALFAVLNLADLGLTRLLLGQGVSAVYEGNPLAAWLLARLGWAGLAAFKFTTALLVAGAAVAVFYRRPRLGVGVLGFACVTLAGVVAYSTLLLGATALFGGNARAHEARVVRQRQELDRGFESVAGFEALKDFLARELIAGRCSIPEAVDRLMTSDKRYDAVWMKAVRRMYGLESDRDCMAANFMNHVMRLVKREPELAERAPEWLAAYEAQFRAPGEPPWVAMGFYRPDSRTAAKTPPPRPPVPVPDT